MDRRYLDFLALRSQALNELQQQELGRLESQALYCHQQNRYLRLRLERTLRTLERVASRVQPIPDPQ